MYVTWIANVHSLYEVSIFFTPCRKLSVTWLVPRSDLLQTTGKKALFIAHLLRLYHFERWSVLRYRGVFIPLVIWIGKKLIVESETLKKIYLKLHCQLMYINSPSWSTCPSTIYLVPKGYKAVHQALGPSGSLRPFHQLF